jgi:hypothetical protein
LGTFGGVDDDEDKDWKNPCSNLFLLNSEWEDKKYAKFSFAFIYQAHDVEYGFKVMLET